jgi:hypothetical protein
VAPLSKFKYPVEKRRNAENVETLRAAEKNLDAFWLKVDRELLDKNGIPQRERLVHIIPYGELQRTPKWVEPAEVMDTVGALFCLRLPAFEDLPTAIFVDVSDARSRVERYHTFVSSLFILSLYTRY